METRKEHRSCGGRQGFYEHLSAQTKTLMRFSVFCPPGDGPMPVLFYLSGLTCTEENFTGKAGAQRFAAEQGLIVVAPDTSPRGDDVPDDEGWDFGKGAGFYVDATQSPFAEHYRMYSYITEELVPLIDQHFPTDPSRRGVTGHSMGGHGALIMGLKRPDLFKSVSAFAPICAPSDCPWGEKAFGGYLGEDRTAWATYDATALLRAGKKTGPILVDQGTADNFLEPQLMPERLEAAAKEVGQPLELRMQEGYDHSYYFVASFIGDHITHHRKQLT